MDDTQTIHVERIGRTPTTAVEVVHSPDDGGYYLGNTDFQRMRQRVSIGIWPTKDAAVAAWQCGEVEWESWRVRPLIRRRGLTQMRESSRQNACDQGYAHGLSVGRALADVADQLVALWENPNIAGLPRAERNAAIDGTRAKLIEAVHEWRKSGHALGETET